MHHFWYPLEPTVQDTSYAVDVEKRLLFGLFNSMQQKKLIRTEVRKAIKNLTVIERQNISQQMTNLLLNVLTSVPYNMLLKNSKNIAVFWPTEYEINSIPLIKFLLLNNKSCYLPIINNNSQTLDFIKYTNNTKLIKNRIGILEPVFNISDQISIASLDLIFMPLVAFDKVGHRIGSGSGLYDRSLMSNSNLSCKLIGLAYSIQQVSEFNPDKWDINLNFVATEQQLFDFS